MPNIQLSRVPGVEPQLLQHLTTHGFASGRDVLLSSTVDMMELLNLTEFKANQLRLAVAAHACPSSTTALALKHVQGVVLATTLPTLDSSMRRGVPAGSVTELVGPAGVGKSQMCFQLSLLCSAPSTCGGLGAVVLYIDTERKFSSSRFAEMAQMRFPQGLSDTAALEATMSRVMLIHPTSSVELLHCLETLEAGIIQHRACLVIVDSIASLARAEYYNSGGADAGRPHHSIVDRQEMLGNVAARLKYLAESFRIPVVVTNQVTTRMTGQVAAHGFQQQQDAQAAAGGYLTAALGTKWAHCVNVRIILERLSAKRYLKVAKSAGTANVALEYTICPRGIEEVLGAEIPPQLSINDVLAMPIGNEVEYQMG